MAELEKATFAAGCFWGVEDAFRKVAGVKSTEVGYTGGETEKPTYESVCRGDTGHAESLNVEFDPEVVSYCDLVDIFWQIHDPTTPNRQGPDIGTQYRSAVFYHNEFQREIAERSKAALQDSGRLRNDVCTEIVPAAEFYRAEQYHQQYFDKFRSG